MKKILSITITLCLVFASVLPVYAEAWTSNQAQNVTSGVAQILAQLLQLNSKFGDIDGSGRGVFDNILLELEHLSGWLVPDGARGASDPTLMDSIVVLVNYAMNHLPDISTIAGYVGSWMSTNNNFLDTLNKGLINYYANNSTWANTANNRQANAHRNLVDFDGKYTFGEILPNGGFNNAGYSIDWNKGSPLGNIAYMIRMLNQGNGLQYQYRWAADLTEYNAQLGIWDSQSDTLTQEAWQPVSAINGLYKYLAYTQRDVARLTYVLASDEEIATREKARATQTAVMDDFVDPDGDGAASVDDFGYISDASSGVQSNFNTGVSAGGVWNVFERNYEWFSQETANNLAYQPNRINKRSKAYDSEYDTPYLDSYYEELHEIIGF